MLDIADSGWLKLRCWELVASAIGGDLITSIWVKEVYDASQWWCGRFYAANFIRSIENVARFPSDI